jgi:pyridoxamine 5'-phosphate oxidase
MMTSEESDAYWYGRPRGSQVSALASKQSQPIEGREALLEQRDAIELQLRDVASLSRPAGWGGIRIVPLRVEFWQHEDDRYHQRLVYRRPAVGTPWSTEFLQP